MKKRRYILGVIATLFFILGSGAPVCAADDAAKIDSVIRTYYDSFVREYLDDFLNTQILEPGDERDKIALMTRNAWSAVGTRDMNIGPVEVALSNDVSTAVARYRASGTLFNKVTGENFAKEMNYIAMLAKQGGVWKIERITPESLFMDEVKTSYELHAASQLLHSTSEKDGAPTATGAKGTAPEEELRLFYDFTQELQGTEALDLSDNKNNGTVHGATQYGSEGLFFDGIDDYIEVPASESLHAEKSLTIVCDITPWSFGNKPWHNIVWKGNPPDGARNSDNREYGVWINSGGFIHFASTPRDRIGTGQVTVNTPGRLVQGRTILACVIDSEKNIMKSYVNGKKVAGGTYSKAGIRDTTNPLTIGGAPAVRENVYFKGYVKSLRIYGRAFSDDDVLQAFSEASTSIIKPLENIYAPREILIRGAWADVSHITRTKFFTDKDLNAMEKGVAIEDGLFCPPGTAGPTEIVYAHDGSPLIVSGYATVIDCIDYCGHKGSVECFITGDGKNLWKSGLIRQQDPAKKFSLDMTGIKELRLISTDGGNGNGEDWAAWLNLKLSVPEKEVSQTPAPATAPIPETPPPAVIDMPESSSGGKGMIDQIFTLIERPSGSGVTSVESFRSTVDQVYVWFTYSNLEPGTILKGVWLDEGRKLTLQEFPVIITQKIGDSGFSIRRPIDGWVRGRYRIDILSGQSTVGTVNFQITK